MNASKHIPPHKLLNRGNKKKKKKNIHNQYTSYPCQSLFTAESANKTAHEHQNWTTEEWKKVTWTDESYLIGTSQLIKLKGCAADILVPDTIVHHQGSSRVHTFAGSVLAPSLQPI